MYRTRIVVVIALALTAMAYPAFAADGPYALTNANLFDGVNNAITENVTVLIRDGRIERIDTGDVNVPSDYTVIDVEGNFLMPGMIDVHTHLNTIERAKRALDSGVTTVRVAGVNAYQDIALRELVRSGKLAGPEVLASGVFVIPDLGPSVLADPRLAEFYDGVDGEEDLRRLVNINIEHGVDVIKTVSTQRSGLPDTDPRQQVYTERELRTIVDEAAKHDVPVLVHAHGDDGARAAVLAGARSIEHGTYLSTETLQLMKERGTWFVPTYITIVDLEEEHKHYVLRLRGRHMLPEIERGIREAHRLGVKLATGADSSYEESSINRISLEIEIFANFGLSNFEALQAGTVSAAELLQVDDRTGRIVAGFEADIIAVPGNPLENIRVLQDVLLVMSNGQLALQRFPFGVTE
jgi:imidazolonepropionase-like amidohydrolase